MKANPTMLLKTQGGGQAHPTMCMKIIMVSSNFANRLACFGEFLRETARFSSDIGSESPTLIVFRQSRKHFGGWRLRV
jgi:hypothetical protein